MNYSDTIAAAKASILREMRRKRRWQTYVVALGLTLCFFLVVGNVLGESSSEPVKTDIAHKEEAPQKEKVKGFQLAESEKAQSTWEASTGVADETPAGGVDSPAQAEPETLTAEVASTNDQPEEPLGDEEAATALTTSFYCALNRGDLGEAYDKLSPEFQESLSYQRFKNGYEVVDAISCEVKHSELLPDDQVRLDLQIEATEAGYSSTYYATCILSKKEDDWTISGVAQLAALDY